MVDQNLLQLLYWAIFKRLPDEAAQGYIGKPIEDVLEILIASEENAYYTDVFEAVKAVENWGREIKL